MFNPSSASGFTVREAYLYCDDVPLVHIARACGTPTYVYSLDSILARAAVLRGALSGRDALVCYSVKANPHAAILTALARAGLGADVVSGGELTRALRAGFPPERIVFAGVGKTEDEIAAAVGAGVRSINVESAGELRRVVAAAESRRTRAAVAIRVNPDVDAQTHRHLTTGVRRSKFGVSAEETHVLFEEMARAPAVECVGLHVHIGSQMTDHARFAEVRAAIEPILADYRARWGEPRLIDIGGGFGVRYAEERVPPLGEFARAAAAAFADVGGTLVIEPGRSLVAEAGALLTRLLYRKPEDRPVHYVVDAGMTDLIRPALYDAHHDVRAIVEAPAPAKRVRVDVVGPVCESSDVLAAARELPDVEPGAVFAIMTAGAYGFAQASTYNSRPRAAEVLVSGDRFTVIRERETIEDVLRGEIVPPWMTGDAT